MMLRVLVVWGLKIQFILHFVFATLSRGFFGNQNKSMPNSQRNWEAAFEWFLPYFLSCLCLISFVLWWYLSSCLASAFALNIWFFSLFLPETVVVIWTTVIWSILLHIVCAWFWSTHDPVGRTLHINRQSLLPLSAFRNEYQSNRNYRHSYVLMMQMSLLLFCLIAGRIKSRNVDWVTICEPCSLLLTTWHSDTNGFPSRLLQDQALQNPPS